MGCDFLLLTVFPERNLRGRGSNLLPLPLFLAGGAMGCDFLLLTAFSERNLRGRGLNLLYLQQEPWTDHLVGVFVLVGSIP